MENELFSFESHLEVGIQSLFVTDMDAYEFLEPLPSQQPEEIFKEINESVVELPKANLPQTQEDCPSVLYNNQRCVECGISIQKFRSFAFKNTQICSKCSANLDQEILSFEEPDKEGRHKKCTRCRKLKHISYFYGSKGKILQTCQKCLVNRSRKYYLWKMDRHDIKNLA